MSNPKLLEDQAIVFEAVKTGDWDSPAMMTLRTLKGRGRIAYIVETLAGLGLCTRNGQLVPEAPTQPLVKPDARLLAATSNDPPKATEAKPAAKPKGA